jgi:hypothetical protein
LSSTATTARDLQRQIKRSRDDRRPVADLVDRRAKVSSPRERAVSAVDDDTAVVQAASDGPHLVERTVAG